MNNLPDFSFSSIEQIHWFSLTGSLEVELVEQEIGNSQPRSQDPGNEVGKFSDLSDVLSLFGRGE